MDSEQKSAHCQTRLVPDNLPCQTRLVLESQHFLGPLVSETEKLEDRIDDLEDSNFVILFVCLVLYDASTLVGH